MRFGSDEWIRALQEELNSSPAYAQAAADWEGDFYFIIEPEEEAGQPTIYYADLWHGRCRQVGRVTDESEYAPQFRLSAPLSAWKAVVQGRLDPVPAIMGRKIRLQGDLGRILRGLGASRELIACLRRVPTEFPDEPP